MGFRLSAYWTMKWLGHVSYWIIVKSQSLEETKFIHAFRCGITGTTGMNSFSRFSSRFLDDSRQFLRFLDDSWTIRNFWMILERGQ
ncbi:unnamed protein product [Rhizophagus irregularis]|nr:unnamed protein product [Rhizophagus irregularis]